MEDKKDYTIKELCQLYNVTSMTIGRWKQKGLPYYKRGRNVFFILEDVEKWIEENNKVEKFNYEDKEKQT